MTVQTQQHSLGAFILALIILIALGFGILWLNGWMIASLWNVVVPTLVPVGKLTVWTALGLELLIIMLITPAVAMARPFKKETAKVDSPTNVSDSDELGPRPVI